MLVAELDDVTYDLEVDGEQVRRTLHRRVWERGALGDRRDRLRGARHRRRLEAGQAGADPAPAGPRRLEEARGDHAARRATRSRSPRRSAMARRLPGDPASPRRTTPTSEACPPTTARRQRLGFDQSHARARSAYAPLSAAGLVPPPGGPRSRGARRPPRCGRHDREHLAKVPQRLLVAAEHALDAAEVEPRRRPPWATRWIALSSASRVADGDRRLVGRGAEPRPREQRVVVGLVGVELDRALELGDRGLRLIAPQRQLAAPERLLGLEDPARQLLGAGPARRASPPRRRARSTST